MPNHKIGAQAQSQLPAGGGSRRRLFWGDLHNHNAVGYATGTLERSIDVAREHLDFFAFTGHASWHDMPKMPGDRHMKWVNGFQVHRDHWPKTQRLLAPVFVAQIGLRHKLERQALVIAVHATERPYLELPLFGTEAVATRSRGDTCKPVAA